MTAKTSGRPIEKATHLQTQIYCVERGLIPTPKASATLGGCSGARKTLDRMKEKGLITEEERRAFASGNGGRVNPEFLEWLMGYERKFTELIPTPIASIAHSAVTGRYWTQNVHVERERERGGKGYHSRLDELVECTPLGKIGLTNPNWIEWLMGFPIGWTDLSASETQ